MLKLETIIKKLKIVSDKNSDEEIAELLNINLNKFNQHKKRNTIPIHEIVDYCTINNIDLNYILK